MSRQLPGSLSQARMATPPAEGAMVAPRRLPSSLTEASSAMRPMPPPFSYEYLYHKEMVETACQALLQARPALIGFDMEWKVCFKVNQAPRPIALMQLCFLQDEAVPASVWAALEAEAPPSETGHAASPIETLHSESAEAITQKRPRPPSMDGCIPDTAGKEDLRNDASNVPQPQRLEESVRSDHPETLQCTSSTSAEREDPPPRLHASEQACTDPLSVGVGLQTGADGRARDRSHSAGARRMAPPHAFPRCRCLLIHVMRTGLTPALRALLEDESIRKCGVGINGDAAKLLVESRCTLGGKVDINSVLRGRVLEPGVVHVERVSYSLADLCCKLLKRKLQKGSDIRCGDWEAFPLPSKQLQYAAIDAFASLLVGMRVLCLPKRATLKDSS